MCVCGTAFAHPPGVCPVCVCAFKVCVTPWGSGGYAYIAQSCLHRHVYIQLCALSEGLSVCSVSTNVCMLFGTTISAYMHTPGAECVCFVCSPVGVCHLCWDRWGYGLYSQAGMCTHMCLGEVSVYTRTVNSSAGGKGAFRVSSRR